MPRSRRARDQPRKVGAAPGGRVHVIHCQGLAGGLNDSPRHSMSGCQRAVEPIQPNRPVARNGWSTATHLSSKEFSVLAIQQRKVHCVTRWASLGSEYELHRALRGIQTPKDHEPLQSEGLAAEATEAVANAALPAAIIEVASGRIMAASPPLSEMFASGGGTVLGRTVDEFMTDQPSGALDLLRAGRLQGYVTTRSLRGRQEEPMPVQVWVRALGTDTPPRFAVAVFATPLTRTGALLPEVARSDLTPVVGTWDESLLIDRVSSDVEALLGYRPSDVLGRSMLALVTESSVPDVLSSLAQAAATGAGVTLNLVACSKQGDPVLLEAVLWPLRPPPRCGFALLPGAYAESAVRDRGRRGELDVPVREGL